MSDQLSLAALGSAFALAALCLHAPALERSGNGAGLAPVAAMADSELPGLPLPSLLTR